LRDRARSKKSIAHLIAWAFLVKNALKQKYIALLCRENGPRAPQIGQKAERKMRDQGNSIEQMRVRDRTRTA
jgi:hypothetical protein